MVTDLEMGILTELSYLCKDRLSKEIVDVVQEMLGALDGDGFVSYQDSKDFVTLYANGINDIVQSAVCSDSLPKKKVGDYEVLNSFEYGGKEVFLGENPRDEAQRYVVGYCEPVMGLYERYVDCLAGNDYNEIVEIYSQRVQGLIDKVKADIEKVPFDRTVIGKDSCDSISGVNLKGKVVVINAEHIKREYAGAERQLCVASGGFGCSPEGSGTKVYCTNLYTGEDIAWHRGDILGTIKPERMPEWAKERLAEIENGKSVDDLIADAAQSCEEANKDVCSKNDVEFGKE